MRLNFWPKQSSVYTKQKQAQRSKNRNEKVGDQFWRPRWRSAARHRGAAACGRLIGGGGALGVLVAELAAAHKQLVRGSRISSDCVALKCAFKTNRRLWRLQNAPTPRWSRQLRRIRRPQSTRRSCEEARTSLRTSRLLRCWRRCRFCRLVRTMWRCLWPRCCAQAAFRGSRHRICAEKWPNRSRGRSRTRSSALKNVGRLTAL